MRNHNICFYADWKEFSLRDIEHQTVTSWMNEFGKRCIIILILFDWSHYTIFGLLKYKSLSAIFFGTVEDGEQIIYVIRPTILSVISGNIYPLLHLTDTTDQIFQTYLGHSLRDLVINRHCSPKWEAVKGGVCSGYTISFIIWENHGIHGMPCSLRIISMMRPEICSHSNYGITNSGA